MGWDIWLGKGPMVRNGNIKADWGRTSKGKQWGKWDKRRY